MVRNLVISAREDGRFTLSVLELLNLAVDVRAVDPSRLRVRYRVVGKSLATLALRPVPTLIAARSD